MLLKKEKKVKRNYFLLTEFALLLFAVPAAAAQVTSLSASLTGQSQASMPAFAKYLLNARFASENQAISIINKQAKDAQTAAHITFLGGVRLEAERQWTHPGVTQTNTLPLPEALGGPIEISTVIVPKVQSTFGIGGEIPLINFQAISGLRMSEALNTQAGLFERAKREEATLRTTEALLKLHVLEASLRAKTEALTIQKERLQYTQLRRKAGLAPILEESLAEADVQMALLKVKQIEIESEKLRAQIETDGGRSIPNNILKPTKFPYVTLKNPSVTHPTTAGLELLKQFLNIQSISMDITDISFYPQVMLGWGIQKKDPKIGSQSTQQQLSLKARWDILDGGIRKRQLAKDLTTLADLRMQYEQALQKVSASALSLARRYQAVEQSLTAAKSAQTATRKAQQAAQDAFRAGLVKFIDVREADRNVSDSSLALIELETAEQSLAIESLVLSHEWLNYLQRVAEEP